MFKNPHKKLVECLLFHWTRFPRKVILYNLSKLLYNEIKFCITLYFYDKNYREKKLKTYYAYFCKHIHQLFVHNLIDILDTSLQKS